MILSTVHRKLRESIEEILSICDRYFIADDCVDELRRVLPLWEVELDNMLSRINDVEAVEIDRNKIKEYRERVVSNAHDEVKRIKREYSDIGEVVESIKSKAKSEAFVAAEYIKNAAMTEADWIVQRSEQKGKALIKAAKKDAKSVCSDQIRKYNENLERSNQLKVEAERKLRIAEDYYAKAKKYFQFVTVSENDKSFTSIVERQSYDMYYSNGTLDDLVQNVEYRQVLCMCIDRLPEFERKVIILRFGLGMDEGMLPDEISKEVGRSVSMVERAIYRALLRIRSMKPIIKLRKEFVS